MPAAPAPAPLAPSQLTSPCDPASLGFDCTDTLPDPPGGLGQARADEALRFGLAMRHPGYHVFVMGASGTGRHATVSRLLAQLAAAAPVPPDLCYRYNFDAPQQARLLSLPAGRGRALKSEMQAFIRDLGPAIEGALDSDPHRDRIEVLQREHKEREDKALAELGEGCATDGLSLLRTAEGFVFAPTAEGQPLSPEAFEVLPKARQDEIEARVGDWSDRLADLLDEFPGWRKDLREAQNRAERDALAPAVTHLMRGLRERYADLPQVLAFFDEIAHDLLDSGVEWPTPGEEDEDSEAEDGSRFHRYQVNLLVDHAETAGAPVVHEDNPSYGNILGRIEHLVQMGTQITNFTLIRAGALHRASGGYLVLDAERLLAQPYAWEGLKRVLRGREVRIEPPTEAQGWNPSLMLEPEPVPADLKVILIGDRELFYVLMEHDADFAEIFKVAADFDDDMPRTPENERRYAQLLSALGRDAALLPFECGAIARLIEQGARLAEDAHRLSLQARHLKDLMREADYHARRTDATRVVADHVDAAIASRARRFDRYPTLVRESMLDGTMLISTDGSRAGQINGLVVVELAGEEFGHPVRITATARLGDGDVVDIERETELGGAIHSKGVLILTAFLAARYARHQPLSLSASLVMEQSYTPVEGDSASLAELCALLSALAEVPIKQCFAVTGSVNQFGEVQVIGGVNAKIEGFFSLCKARGLTGEQGVLIPTASARHLMLSAEVVEAARAGRFHIHAVDTVDTAMSVLTGLPAGTPDSKGQLPRGSLNHRVATALADLSASGHAGKDGPRPRHRRRLVE